MLGAYADQLQQVNGRLYLTGLSEAAHQQVVRSDKLPLSGALRHPQATPIVWETHARGRC